MTRPENEHGYARVHLAGADTLEALASRLVGPADLAASTRRAWLWLLKKHVFPKLGPRDPASISRGDLRELLAGIPGRTVANDALKVVRWVFARAVEADLVPHNPAAGLRKPSTERPRDRVLAPRELRALWTAAGAAGTYGAAVRFAILTAARREEVFSARRDELDLGLEVWRIPAARAKNRRVHEVPLTKAAVEVVLSVQAASGRSARGWIFSGRGGGPLRPTSKAWAKLLRTAGIIEEVNPHADEPPRRTRSSRWGVRFQDLRRTVRDALTRELGVSVPVAEAVLGHAPPKVAASCAPGRIPLKETRRALERWASELQRIVGARPEEKVARMPARA